ncbi:VOC family protein [Pseudomonas sp. REP124]|uniref:VOC family protein n=1 Tax=Pseudomonas sp. REP124 TaxID=2875731 RepID=UPI001CCAFD34|nr:VOC family protein [Pseudomonas sp. REP124]MBZ9780254.1 VOC family protein [Pseudomonas sp. REP124]
MKAQFFVAAILFSTVGFASAQSAGSVAARMDGVQHFGITVKNIARAHKFYTEVLGGTEIMRDGDFQGDQIHNTLMQIDDLNAKSRGVNPRSIGVPDLRSGDQRLDVVFIQFKNVVIELLQYRNAVQEPWTEGTFAPAHENTAPSFPTNMHVSFQVREDADFDQFIADMEKEAKALGMNNVRCNRNVSVASESERISAPIEDNALEISEGKSNGWALAYCKGPEGEQMEFNQVKAPVKQLFEKSKQTHDKKYESIK